MFREDAGADQKNCRSNDADDGFLRAAFLVVMMVLVLMMLMVATVFMLVPVAMTVIVMMVFHSSIVLTLQRYLVSSIPSIIIYGDYVKPCKGPLMVLFFRRVFLYL